MTTARQLPLSRLGHLVPPLLENQPLVALVALTEDLPWAAKAAWDIARIAARDGRRVALVDLNLERPVLHEIVGLSPAAGIVDALEDGASLNTAAHEVMGVFFTAGSRDTVEIRGHGGIHWPGGGAPPNTVMDLRHFGKGTIEFEKSGLVRIRR